MPQTLSPIVAVHLTFALSAVLIGPLALWARRGPRVLPRLHRAAGYAWVTCMLGAATSSLFIREHEKLNWLGFSPIHLLVPVTYGFLYMGLRAVLQGQIERHRRTMQGTYIGACLITGLFTLLPQRYLGQWLWGALLPGI